MIVICTVICRTNAIFTRTHFAIAAFDTPHFALCWPDMDASSAPICSFSSTFCGWFIVVMGRCQGKMAERTLAHMAEMYPGPCYSLGTRISGWFCCGMRESYWTSLLDVDMLAYLCAWDIMLIIERMKHKHNKRRSLNNWLVGCAF